jgi:hypothetical protein
VDSTLKNLSYQFGMGFLMRAKFRRLIRESCFNLGLELNIHEEGGWLRSTYYVDIYGADKEIDQMEEFLDGLILRFGR